VFCLANVFPDDELWIGSSFHQHVSLVFAFEKLLQDMLITLNSLAFPLISKIILLGNIDNILTGHDSLPFH
jgi:hypothetical protein